MGEWLVADVSVLDVHFQLWMLLVLGILLCWFIFVGNAECSLRFWLSATDSASFHCLR